MKHFLFILFSSISLFAATQEIRLGNINRTTSFGTNTWIIISTITESATNTFIVPLEKLMLGGTTNSSTVFWTVESGKLVPYVTNIANAQISGSAAIAASKLDSTLIVESEINSIGELETLTGLDILTADELASQALFEGKLFTLPSGGGGSGDDVYLNGSNITNPNLSTGTNMLVLNPANSNIFFIPTNLTSSLILNDTILNEDINSSANISATKLESAVIVLSEIDSISEIELITGVDILTEDEIDSESEFESKLFTLPEGGGADSNWTALGTTNSVLDGFLFAHAAQVTNSFTVVGDGTESYGELAEEAAPTTPATGFFRFYVKTDGLLYGLNDAGVEILLSNSSITSSQITDNTLTTDDLGPDSVGSSELNAGAVAAELEAELDFRDLSDFESDFIEGTIEFFADNGGSALETGIIGTPTTVDFSGTITGYSIDCDQSGSIVVDIWKESDARDGSGIIDNAPDNADSITDADPPTLSSQQGKKTNTMTGWTPNFSSGDTFLANIDSATTVTRVKVTLYYVK